MASAVSAVRRTLYPRLAKLNPALVIVQAGHNDMGVPAPLEQLRVKQVIAQIRAAAPDADIALITVFVGRLHRPAAYQTDRTIVAAAKAADPAVIIMDPLAARWKYARIRDGLHPTAAGSQWIAGQVGQTLEGRGVHPMLALRGASAAPGGRPDSVVCNFGLQFPHLLFQRCVVHEDQVLVLRDRLPRLHHEMVDLAFHRQSGVNPALLAFRIISHVGVSHGRQFPGGVL